MSEQHFLRCNCQHCGSPIEFPSEGAGLKTDCPHCGQETLLSEPVTADAAEQALPTEAASDMHSSSVSPAGDRKKPPLLAGALVLLALAVLAGGGWYFLAGPGANKLQTSGAEKVEPRVANVPQPPVAKQVPSSPATNLPALEPVESNAAVETTQEVPKSIDDLKPGTVTLEKAKSGNLVHAVGTIKNNSDLQRFGVKVELELTDASGRPAGKASDYTQVIEPRQEWRFRALVLDPKGSRAVAGRVSSIKEDN